MMRTTVTLDKSLVNELIKRGQSLMIPRYHPETMKLTKRFCRGSRGVVFSKRTPLAAGGKNVISWQAGKTIAGKHY